MNKTQSAARLADQRLAEQTDEQLVRTKLLADLEGNLSLSLEVLKIQNDRGFLDAITDARHAFRKIAGEGFPLTHNGVGEGDESLPSGPSLCDCCHGSEIPTPTPRNATVDFDPVTGGGFIRTEDTPPTPKEIIQKELDSIPDLPSTEASTEPTPGGGWTADEVLAAGSELDGFLSGFLSEFSEGGIANQDDVENAAFVTFFRKFSVRHHADMKAKGFWDDEGAEKALSAIDAIGALKSAGALVDLTAEEKEGVRGLVGVAVDRASQPARNDLSDLMLVVTEIASAAEGGRKDANAPDDKIPAFTSFEAELADVVLRIMDFGAGRRLRIAEAIVAKKAFNLTRERLHGKTC